MRTRESLRDSLSTAQQLGGAVAQASVSSFHLVFSISAVMLLAAAALSLRLPAFRQKTDLADMVH